jgi:hypothetical protein
MLRDGGRGGKVRTDVSSRAGETASEARKPTVSASDVGFPGPVAVA